MPERGAGRILLISRAAAFTGGIIGPHYAASKAGPRGLTHFPASRLAANQGHGQRADPGAGHRDQDAARRPVPAARQVPGGRLGQPSQVTECGRSLGGLLGCRCAGRVALSR
jgi:3-oxoacyl-[acyl-carrier protein] reductase